MKEIYWWQLDINGALSELGSSGDNGLHESEALQRLNQGKNELEKKSGVNPWLMFINQFLDTMVLVLLGATVFSAIVGSLADALTILTIVVINALLGFIQEYRAEKSLEAIQKLASPSAQVIRGGNRIKIPAAELVPGDLILLETGDRVPADARLIQSYSLEIDESTLTGESLPVTKDAGALLPVDTALADRHNMAYMSTVVTRGRARAVVSETGMDTTIGQIVRIIKESDPGQTPLQQKLDRLGKILIVICLGVCTAVAALGVYRGEAILTMFMAGISLAVAAIPEGLPAIVTVVLALGVQRMAQCNAIIRKLPAVETLGCTTVICSDKTGTLTQNKMSVVKVATLNRTLDVEGQGYDPKGRFRLTGQAFSPLADKAFELLMETAYNCNNAYLEKRQGFYEVQGDPTEGALKVMAMRAGIEKALCRLREVPFDSDRKRMSVVVEKQGSSWVLCKGALEVLLPRCSRVYDGKTMSQLSARAVSHFTGKQEEWAGQGCRVLALAMRSIGKQEATMLKEGELESDLCLLGICALVDPPRPAVKGAVAECQAAGIIPVMITGDHPVTAAAIAAQIGLSQGEKVVSGKQMDRMNDDELYRRIMHDRVFARVTPQHKNRIVKVLKRNQEVAAMTGDGVNDAPALKAADIGIAMGISGTEVAKEASAMVLADDDFSTIVKAVHEGRAIYDNIRKFIRYLLGCNIGEVMVMFLASLLGMPLPLLPIQILWVNLVTDGLPAMALGLEPAEPGIMKRPPRSSNDGIFARGLGYKVFARGVFISLITLAAFIIGMVYARMQGNLELDLARSMALTTLVLGQLFFVFECRSEQFSPFQLGFFGNRFLIAAVACSVVMHLSVLMIPFMQNIFHTTPLNGWQWLVVLLLSGPKFLVALIQYTWQRIFVSGPDYVKINA